MTQPKVGEFAPVARGLYLEGLAVDLERGVVWYSDVIAGGVHGVWPDGRTQTFNPERMWTGGVLVNEDGSVLSSGQGGIMWNNPMTGASGWLLREIDGAPINGVNEMMPDGTGGIYFGTNDIEKIVAGEPVRPSALYRLTLDRQVIRVSDDMHFTNGLMLSADHKHFYCNDTFVSTYVFDVQPDLSLTNKRVLVDKEDVDGMALDVEGNLWITGFKSTELTRVKPDGTPLPPIPTPGGVVTQIRFFGPDMCDYYINSVPAGSGEGLAVGELPNEKGSILYRGRADIAGQPVPPSRFKLS
jgi:sugar lactone lactonase YvrE